MTDRDFLSLIFIRNCFAIIYWINDKNCFFWRFFETWKEKSLEIYTFKHRTFKYLYAFKKDGTSFVAVGLSYNQLFMSFVVSFSWQFQPWTMIAPTRRDASAMTSFAMILQMNAFVMMAFMSWTQPASPVTTLYIGSIFYDRIWCK